MSRFTYTKENAREISFPLGGIGTGCIGLAGNGQLVDMEIFNRPNKGSHAGMSHFAIKAEDGGSVLDARVINGDSILKRHENNFICHRRIAYPAAGGGQGCHRRRITSSRQDKGLPARQD